MKSKLKYSVKEKKNNYPLQNYGINIIDKGPCCTTQPKDIVHIEFCN